MHKRIMHLLMALAREMVENNMRIEDALIKLDDSRPDLYDLRDELRIIERSNMISGEEIDALKSLIMYVFMKHSDLEPEDVYAIVFGSGRAIIWN